MTTLTITRPDDWRVHLRDGAALRHTCADMACYFGRAIVMPNLTPPVTTVAEAALTGSASWHPCRACRASSNR